MANEPLARLASLKAALVELASSRPDLADAISKSLTLLEQARSTEQKAIEALSDEEKLVLHQEALSLLVEAEEAFFVALDSRLAG